MVENIECALSRTRDTAVNGIHENRFTNLSLEVSSDGMDFTKGTIGFPSETYRYRQSISKVCYVYTSNTKGNVYNGIAVESSSRANYEFLIQSLEINRSAYRIFARVSRFFDSLAVYNLDKIWHTVARREKVAQGYAELGFSFFFSFSFFLPSTCVSFYVTKKKEEVYIIANVAA